MVQLSTARLVLREFAADDWRAVQAYQSDPRYLRYYEWTERPERDVREFVGRFIAQQSEQPRTRYQLAIVLKDDGGLIGNCGIRMDAPGATEADVGYELAPEQWGRGYASEAARAIVAFGFDALRVHRICAACVADNVASAHVLEKLGMQLEGRLRDHRHYKGRWWDTLVYAILEHEWRAAQAAAITR